ncbi:MAG TPA: hypothetical protein VNT26_08650, partial [Candidatus Sulfotelmatobacter sp.]|nr:hypothetical protein [Candidatus Sulfotelmatobacter sp.]
MEQASQPSGALPRIMVQYKRELLWALVTLAILLPLGYAAKVRADAAADARQGVVLSAPGVVTVPRVQLMSEVTGVVREVPAKGARVTQGQPLARLEDLDLEAAVVSARLELEAARAGLVKAQTPIRSEELEDLDAAIELATIALDAAQKATDSLHAGINAASAPRQDLQAVLNEELKAIQAKADQTPAPHHASAAPAADPAAGHVHPQGPADPAPPAEEDCEVHQQLRELTRLFETVIVRAAAADQPVSAARDTTLMEQLMAQVEIAKVNLRQAIAKKARV